MTSQNAQLYRMEMPEHICPSGLKAKALLEKRGISFHDHKFTDRQQVDIFKAEHGVETTPQIWLDGKRIGAVSVFKAVYIDKRDLRCACVGGNSNVPLGFVSVTENLMMLAMAFWMLLK